VLIVVVLVVMVILGRRVFARRDGRAAMKSPSSVAGMTGREAKARGTALRPSLVGADGGTRMSEYGSLLGTVGRAPVYKFWEDVAVVFMGPRSNKTSAIAVPGILSAPGAVVATSKKPDLWMLTAALRAEVGDVYVLDPQRIAFVPQTWWWNHCRWSPTSTAPNAWRPISCGRSTVGAPPAAVVRRSSTGPPPKPCSA